METKKLTTDQVAMLKRPLPPEAVSPHPTKTYLSSIKAIYVVERLNEVFGIGAWKLESKEVVTKDKMIVVQSFFKVPEYGIELESYGGNDNADLGDAYKGATTDALTKICSFLEIGMDVFKGIKTPPPAPAEKKVYLNENSPEFEKAIEFLKGGGSIEKIDKKYTLSPTVREALLTQAI